MAKEMSSTEDGSRQIETLLREVWKHFLHYWKGLAWYSLFFKILGFVVLAPAAVFLLRLLVTSTGRMVAGNDDIQQFLLSATGILWIVASGVILLLTIFLESGGMILIGFSREIRASSMGPLDGLWRVWRRLPALINLGLRHVLGHLLTALVPLGVAGLSFLFMLGDYDIYYLVTIRPPVFWAWIGIALMCIAAIAVMNGRLYFHWMLSLPAVLLEQQSPKSSLSRSRKLVEELPLQFCVKFVALAILLLLLPGMLSWILLLAGEVGLGLLPEYPAIIVTGVALFLMAQVVVSVCSSFLANALHSMMIGSFYWARTDERTHQSIADGDRAMECTPVQARKLGRRTAALVGLAALLVLAFSIVYVQKMDLNNEVEITAHRGSSITAPENSLSAIRQAIEDGADYAEIDVQETRDGTIVLFHDTDLLRVYGIKKNIWEVDYSEIAGLDSGSWFSTDFASERIATLQQAIETARGRIRLNIELKFNPYSKRLAEQVLDILEQENFSDQVLVTSLDLSGLQRLRALNPDVRVGYIVFRAIGNLMRLDVDALSVSAAIAEPWFVTHAHRSGKEVHVWTVNERADMQRFVDYGVDNIITDHPALLRDVLRDRSEMSREARLLIRARHWF